MKNIETILLVCGMGALAACEFNGSMKFLQSTHVIDRKGDAHVLAAGTYSTDIESSVFGKKIRFEIVKADGKKVKMQFPAPSELKNENYEGPIRLLARDIGQSFGVEGSLDVRRETSGPYNRTVTCVYDRYLVRECFDKEVTLPDGRKEIRRVCEDRERIIEGRRDERYEVTSTDRIADLKLIHDQTKKQIGSYRGVQDLGSTEHILSSSYCRRY